MDEPGETCSHTVSSRTPRRLLTADKYGPIGLGKQVDDHAIIRKEQILRATSDTFRSWFTTVSGAEATIYLGHFDSAPSMLSDVHRGGKGRGQIKVVAPCRISTWGLGPTTPMIAVWGKLQSSNVTASFVSNHHLTTKNSTATH